MMHNLTVFTTRKLAAAILLLLVTIAMVFTACTSKKQANNPPATNEKVTDAPPMEDTAQRLQPVGGQRDEHGCLIGAGYTWSQVQQSCVRLFESGIRLNPQDASLDQTTSAFIIFNDDNTVAELFLPGKQGSLLLQRTGTEGNYQWKSGEYALSAWKGYVLQAAGKTLYHGQ